ncbi:NlpC/P60 family protein [Microvirga lenta]|uniref:NlpC/P60 family protein n=1 Tax=Microvirga lenta TaxID=2881337 RepID=UPI001CFDAA7B|nr:NlpC/P60 family protein [Microvirga lenta]MCB5173639.1 C40 family peptidase [Microvirga lenta]
MTDRLAFLEGLIGKPYQIGARGPAAYDCYGLARHIQNELAGVSMPDIGPVEPTTRAQAEAMLSHPERQAWEEVPESEAQDLDLVLMGNVAKRDFHLGTFVRMTTTGAVIHIDKAAGVVVDDIPALRAIGYNHLRVFRRKA